LKLETRTMAVALSNLMNNGYRVLGLTGAATQADVDAAARQLRLWDDPKDISATTNDALWIGPIPRRRQDIELAVARLTEPGTRLRERMWWFVGTPPIGGTHGRLEGSAPFDQTHGGPRGGDWRAVHDRLLVQLYHGLTREPTAGDFPAWRGLIKQFETFAASDDVLDALVDLELSGDFEKRASLEEIATALHAVPGEVAGALVEGVEGALDDPDRVAAAAALARQVRTIPVARQQVDRVFNRLEDMLATGCAEQQHIVSTAWKTRKVQAMLAATGVAQRNFERECMPLVNELAHDDMADEERRGRVALRAAHFYMFLGEANAAAYDFAAAKRAYARAKFLAGYDPLARQAQGLIEKSELSLKRQRAGLVPRGTAQRRWGFSFSGGRWWWGAIVLVIALVRGLGMMVAPEQSTTKTVIDGPTAAQLEAEEKVLNEGHAVGASDDIAALLKRQEELHQQNQMAPSAAPAWGEPMPHPTGRIR
jgi:hypothetical protein